MKIELDETRESVYSNFLDYMKSSETKRMYVRNLKQFLNLIPNKIFEDYLGETPKSREIEDLSDSFARLAKKDLMATKQIIKSYIKETKKEVESKKYSPSIVKRRVQPIKTLLAANEIDISWSLVNKMFPREVRTDDRAYTKEEIQSMLEHCTSIIDKLIVLMFSSGGFRLESWDYFCWKDVVFFPEGENEYKGAALRVYRGDPEEYWTFITPETCKILHLYREEWKSRFLNYPNDDDPLIASSRFDFPHRLKQKGVRARVDKIVTKIGLRDQHKKDQRRYEVQLDHGFRKYFNTMMRRAKVDFADKEDMMGHKNGLEKHYERYQEEDFERFPEYQKAIPFLTISDKERIRIENEKLKEEKSELKVKESEILDIKKQLENLKIESQNEIEKLKYFTEISEAYLERGEFPTLEKRGSKKVIHYKSLDELKKLKKEKL